MAWRIGQGFDAHRFVGTVRGASGGADGLTGPPWDGEAESPPSVLNNQRPLRLALLDWPGEPPLAGHSDGDVAAHALVDAIASAAGLGDIGSLFGTDRPEYQDADSAIFLERTAREARAAGFAIEHASVQIVGVRPRVATRRREAEDGIGRVLGAPVSLTATTTDGMGFTGRGEGLAAIAVCLLRHDQ
jgi:2-C-methyl-D-erythritol 2,4-cyclodiphosphate synthase